VSYGRINLRTVVRYGTSKILEKYESLCYLTPGTSKQFRSNVCVSLCAKIPKTVPSLLQSSSAMHQVLSVGLTGGDDRELTYSCVTLPVPHTCIGVLRRYETKFPKTFQFGTRTQLRHLRHFYS